MFTHPSNRTSLAPASLGVAAVRPAWMQSVAGGQAVAMFQFDQAPSTAPSVHLAFGAVTILSNGFLSNGFLGNGFRGNGFLNNGQQANRWNGS